VQLALPPLTPVTRRLMVLNAAIFLVAWLLRLFAPGALEAVYTVLSLDPWEWREWFPLVPVWQLVTYGFLHSTASLGHLFWNLLQLYFFGTLLEGTLGSRRFLTTYLLGMVVGALLHLLLEGLVGSERAVVGASGAVLCVVVATATLQPRTRVLLLFIPVQLWLLAGVIVLLDLMAALEGLVSGWSDGVAHWVHLGGALWGFVAVRTGWVRIDWLERLRARRAVAEEQSRREEGREMDRLLAKIHREGIGSLTPAERRFLERVSSRR
jgi:membrane associated rhomboid family serine protease